LRRTPRTSCCLSGHALALSERAENYLAQGKKAMARKDLERILAEYSDYSWEVAVKHDWSPDGKLIVLTTNADFVRPNESANLVTIRPDGSGKTDLTGFTAGTENAFAGSFSPDGEQIVFRIESGDTYSLAVIDRDGGNLRRIATGKGRPRNIDWETYP
jgi:Tol biopolymer transport system component